MEFALVPDAAAYAERAGPFLMADEVAHNLALGILALAGPEAVLALVDSVGGVQAAAVMVPPRNLVLSRVPAVGALGVLTRGLYAAGIAVPGVVGPAAEALAFAGAWRALTLMPAHRTVAMQLYRAERAIDPPDLPPGARRLAGPADVDLVARWITAFNEEALPGVTHDADAARRRAEDHIARGKLWLWEDGGAPVAMTAAGGSTQHGARVYAVYTPPARRRRGYASALVAQVTRELLASGKLWTCLFTDRMNPTTNHIYSEIGYRPVAAFDDYRFG